MAADGLTRGVVACGHRVTARAAREILEEGGNAFDATVAAQLAACVAEPVLTPRGGGGFLLARTQNGHELVYDYFVQTPKRRVDRAPGFYPVHVDFGTTRQEFHIGAASIATPGMVKGLFAIHHDLCRLPMTRLAQPALRAARAGVVVDALQSYIFDVVKSIYLTSAESRAIFESRERPSKLVQEGEILRQPQLADTIAGLAEDGDAWFYEGEPAQRVDELSRDEGGHLRVEDFRGYRVSKREPLRLTYRQARLLTNPPPSSGGMLIAFALKLLEATDVAALGVGTRAKLSCLAHVMSLTNKARVDSQLESDIQPRPEHVLDPRYLELYRAEVSARASASLGTTHISVIDAEGNVASMSSSSGEGCGYLIPGTGIPLNNMLGEEDLNPGGFNRWPEDQRMTSMMAPTLLERSDGTVVALGSGGSNRLRTAILQVLTNLIDHGLSLGDAVCLPRIHRENDLLNVESGFEPAELAQLLREYPEHRLWDELNLFFGGVHAVSRNGDRYGGAGDPRRGGVAVTARGNSGGTS